MIRREYAAAGTIIVVGVFVMATGLAFFMAESSEYWNEYAKYGSAGAIANLGKKVDLYQSVVFFGLLLIGLGLAVLAFALARERPSQSQFREVPSHIPLEQYPQPPKSP